MRSAMRWLGRMVRFRLFTVLTGAGIVYSLLLALLLIGALVRQINLLVALYGMLAGPFMMSWWLSRGTLRRLRFHRRVPRSVQAGEPFVVTLELFNDRPRLPSWATVIHDQIWRPLNSHAVYRPSVLFLSVPAGQSRRQTYRAVLPERGRYRLGSLQVSTRFPFGLLRSFCKAPLEAEVLVTPRLGKLTHEWQTRLAQAFESGELGFVGRAARTGEFFGLREWRSDDGRRAIHWRSTARRRTLIARKFEQQRTQEISIVLDLWQPSAPDPRAQEHVEWAVSFVATLVQELEHRPGTRVRCTLRGNDSVELVGPATAAFTATIAERLATLGADPHDRLGEILGQACDSAPSAGAFVLVTTRPPQLMDPRRFAGWWYTPNRRHWLERLLVVDTSHSDFSQCLDLDGATP